MPVTTDKPAPYTSPQVVVDLIERHRARGLPSPVNPEVLSRAGVSESLIPRTMQSLLALDLIDEQGTITKEFEGIRLAPAAEYQARLLEWLTATYADVLAFVDPATDDETKVRDAFRAYKPVGQQERMVTLFLRLCVAAGIDVPKRGNGAAPKPRAPRPAAQKPKTATLPPPPPPPSPAGSGPKVSAEGLPPALVGLLQSLPPEGQGWSKSRRDQFVNTFGAVVDFCFPIVSENENGD